MTVVSLLVIVPLLLLVLLIVGGLASVVFLVSRAEIRKRPAWAGLLIPLGVLAGMVAMAILLAVLVPGLLGLVPGLLGWGRSAMVQQVGSGLPHEMAQQAQIQISTGHLTIFGWVLIIALAVAAMMAVSHFVLRSNHRGEHGGHGLGAAAVILLLMLVAGIGLFLVAPTRRQPEEARVVAGHQSMQALWDEVNKPRIRLEAGDQGAAIATVDGKNVVTIEDGPKTGAKVTVAGEVVASETADEEAAAGADSAATEEDSAAEAATEEDSAAETASATASETPDKPRPAWVNDPPKRVGPVWREVVATDEYATTDECNEAADALLYDATWRHVQQLVDQPNEAIWRSDDASSERLAHAMFARSALLRMGVGIDTIRRQMVPENREYLETVERSFGPMKKLYTQLEFTPSVDRELRQRWETYERRSRLAGVGVSAGLVVAVVGLAYGLLKIDTWTKGYYTKRLFLGVPAAIIGLIALAAAIVGP